MAAAPVEVGGRKGREEERGLRSAPPFCSSPPCVGGGAETPPPTRRVHACAPSSPDRSDLEVPSAARSLARGGGGRCREGGCDWRARALGRLLPSSFAGSPFSLPLLSFADGVLARIPAGWARMDASDYYQPRPMVEGASLSRSKKQNKTQLLFSLWCIHLVPVFHSFRALHLWGFCIFSVSDGLFPPPPSPASPVCSGLIGPLPSLPLFLWVTLQVRKAWLG